MLTREQAVAQLTKPGAAFELQEQEIRGSRMNAYAVGPFNLTDILRNMDRYGTRDYLVYGDERYSFTEAQRLAAGLAKELSATYGVRPGDRVAVAMRNYPEFALFFWATISIGAIFVPLNAWWSSDELVYGLTDSGAVLLAADRERLASLSGRLSSLELRGIISVRVDDTIPAVDRLSDVLARSPANVEVPPGDMHTDDDVTILYTSGTTGRARGVVHSHRNHVTNLLNMLIYGAASTLMADAPPPVSAYPTPDLPLVQPAQLVSLPFFHIGAISSLIISAFTGTKLVLMYKWDPELALDLVERERISALQGVPMMVSGVLNHPDLRKRDVSSLKSVGIGGTAVPPDLILQVKKIFGGSVVAGTAYGMTESTSVVTMIFGPDYWEFPTSVGTAAPTSQIELRDEMGRPVPTGEPGELWTRGPNISRGYWNNPEATAASFDNGWHRSGDVFRVDSAGRYFLLDRIKDIVIRGGENIYCGEVEAALQENVAVLSTAAIGLPHPSLGEELVAVVRLREGATVTADELRQTVRNRLAAFKVPSRIFFTAEDLPRTPTGKVIKRQLREQYRSEA